MFEVFWEEQQWQAAEECENSPDFLYGDGENGERSGPFKRKERGAEEGRF